MPTAMGGICKPRKIIPEVNKKSQGATCLSF